MSSTLRGRAGVIPDKSLTHRGLLIGALSEGETEVRRPNPGRDCLATASALRALGVEIAGDDDCWRVRGGASTFRAPAGEIDLENAGTGLRLLAGLVAGFSFECVLTGDESLRRRPMERIAAPLRRMGAEVELRDGAFAPVRLRGGELTGIDHRPEVASAQVKSAVLLAGLSAREGETRVFEIRPTRDHTERLLRFHGLQILQGDGWSGVPARGRERLQARGWTVPGDVSAAVFFLVGALIGPGSEIALENVGVNPTRTGALDVLRRMGARIEVEPENSGDDSPEPVAIVRARTSALRGTVVESHEIPRLIDEVPVLAVAAATAEGPTEFQGVGELRVKESDRLESTAEMIRALGGRAEVEADRLRVLGGGALRGGRVRAHHDHRIAMAAWIAGAASADPVEVDDLSMIATSDPYFEETWRRLRGER